MPETTIDRLPVSAGGDWGRARVLHAGPASSVELVELRALHRLPMRHYGRSSIRVAAYAGEVSVSFGGRLVDLPPGHALDLPPCTAYRVEAVTDAVVLEVRVPGPGFDTLADDRHDYDDGGFGEPEYGPSAPGGVARTPGA